MHAIHREFTKIINGTTQFTIPVFQRNYTWKEPNCELLNRFRRKPTDSQSYVTYDDHMKLLDNVRPIMCAFLPVRSPSSMSCGGNVLTCGVHARNCCSK
jgi:hypothetical protein